jgi:outer membrane biosynthesis protein TonB
MAGLSHDQLESIRDTLAAGRKPRVMFTDSAGQIAGQIGQVIELTDPQVSDEFVVVRFGRDELPFSPVDLTIPPRGAKAASARAKKAAPEPEPEPVPAPEFKITRTPVPAPRKEAKVTTVDAPASQPAPAPAADKPRKAAGKAARPKAPAGLTVTLAYTDGEWTVAATQGTKSLAKPYVVKPVEALKIVGLVDVPGVKEAVEQILAAERTEAEQQAEELRAELAEIEARLAELRDAG